MSDPDNLESRLHGALGQRPDPARVEEIGRWLAGPDRHLLALDDAEFPALLREIPDPPRLLYATGRIELLRRQCLAIVGSRNATPQATRDARDFACELSDAGLCIVSGLALGVDAAAHEGGLAGASSSIAVLGTGADVSYPRGNSALAARLSQSGCVVTEYPLGTPPLPGNFPRRNRLISGLARGVLVIEASIKSGSLVTARLGAEQNREVFALPGSIHNTKARGCHKLIRDGAKLVECTNDVLEELGMPTGPRAPNRHEGAESNRILRAMGGDPVSLDQVIVRSGLAASACAAELAMLEIDGRIEALGGGIFQRVERPS